jgi:predicted ATPase
MKPSFLLSSLALKNFKAVRNSGAVKLTPLTVLIGNNGSGKSSLIEGLETYQETVTHGLDAAMERWLGFEHIWNKRARHHRKNIGAEDETYENPMVFALRGHISRGSFTVHLEISADPGINGVRIEREVIKLPGDLLVRRDRRGHATISRGPEPERQELFHPFESATQREFGAIVSSWQFLSFDPGRMGMPIRQTMAPAPCKLQRDGSNLGQYLWEIRQQDLAAFEGILEALRFVLPFSADIQPRVTQEIERLVHLQMTEADFKVPGWLLSTGTLRVLAILAVLRHPHPPPLLVVEEIENGLDPRTLQLVVEEIRGAISSGTTQIIATTHSPYLLDLLDLSHLVLTERVDDEPRFTRPADREELQRWAHDFSPGQLYTMGRLTAETRA